MPTLVLKFGDNIRNKFSFDKSIVTLGRSTDNDIVVENLAVSRHHAQIEKIGNSFILSDLNSANGTFVNGERVLRRPLKHFDTITIGKHHVVFLEEPKTAPVMEDVISPADFDRTIIVNPNPVTGKTPEVHLTPPKEIEKPLWVQPEMPTQRVQPQAFDGDFIASSFSMVYHHKNCDWVQGIKPENRVFFEDESEAEYSGRRSCRICMNGYSSTGDSPKQENLVPENEQFELVET